MQNKIIVDNKANTYALSTHIHEFGHMSGIVHRNESEPGSGNYDNPSYPYLFMDDGAALMQSGNLVNIQDRQDDIDSSWEFNRWELTVYMMRCGFDYSNHLVYNLYSPIDLVIGIR